MAHRVCLQALPCCAPQFLGKKFYAFDPIIPRPGASLEELFASMQGRPKFCASVLADDCESVTDLAHEAADSLKDFTQRNGNLQEECEGYAMFRNWTKDDFEILQNLMMVGGQMLIEKVLTISNTVGLASGASASQDPGVDNGDLNGHCFNVGRFIDTDDGSVHCFILEGTAPMQQMKVTDTSPRVTAMVRGLSSSGDKNWAPMTMDMPKFLTMLGKTVAVLTQVANEPKGGNSGSGGVVGKEKLTGWISSKEVINSLDSDPKFPMPFYNLIVYMGWKCTETGVGCMPIRETGCTLVDLLKDNPQTPRKQKETEKFMGVPPHLLADSGLRGLDVSLTDEQLKMMQAIYNEAQPPLASEMVFKRLANYWHPADSLLAEPVIPYGEENKYVIASCMESPGCPDYIHLNLAAKKIIFDEANRLNALRNDSDGIRAFVRPSATGDMTLLRVPYQNISKVTFVDSVITAMKNKNWPGVSTISRQA